MSDRLSNLDKRAQEKHLQREEDRRALESGQLSKEELRRKHGYFAIDAVADLSQADF